MYLVNTTYAGYRFITLNGHDRTPNPFRIKTKMLGPNIPIYKKCQKFNRGSIAIFPSDI